MHRWFRAEVTVVKTVSGFIDESDLPNLPQIVSHSDARSFQIQSIRLLEDTLDLPVDKDIPVQDWTSVVEQSRKTRCEEQPRIEISDAKTNEDTEQNADLQSSIGSKVRNSDDEEKENLSTPPLLNKRTSSLNTTATTPPLTPEGTRYLRLRDRTLSLPQFSLPSPEFPETTQIRPREQACKRTPLSIQSNSRVRKTVGRKTMLNFKTRKPVQIIYPSTAMSLSEAVEMQQESDSQRPKKQVNREAELRRWGCRQNSLGDSAKLEVIIKELEQAKLKETG